MGKIAPDLGSLRQAFGLAEGSACNRLYCLGLVLLLLVTSGRRFTKAPRGVNYLLKGVFQGGKGALKC
jgi:hypothetical protein